VLLGRVIMHLPPLSLALPPSPPSSFYHVQGLALQPGRLRAECGAGCSARVVAWAAALKGYLDGLKWDSMPRRTFLDEAGCKWTGGEAEISALSASPAILRYCLQHKLARSMKCTMYHAISSGSLECMEVLFDHGYIVEMQRYTFWSDAPLDRRMYEAAIASDSLECQKCAHERKSTILLGGTAAINPTFDARRFCGSKARAAKSLPCCGPCVSTWRRHSREVLYVKARALADHARSTKLALEDTDWQMVLDLERYISSSLPPSIRALAASRGERRVVFGGALFKANQQAGKCPHDPSRALWSVVPALPSELGSASKAMCNPTCAGRC
jgi:hypothetical protein